MAASNKSKLFLAVTNDLGYKIWAISSLCSQCWSLVCSYLILILMIYVVYEHICLVADNISIAVPITVTLVLLLVVGVTIFLVNKICCRQPTVKKADDRTQRFTGLCKLLYTLCFNWGKLNTWHWVCKDSFLLIFVIFYISASYKSREVFQELNCFSKNAIMLAMLIKYSP